MAINKNALDTMIKNNSKITEIIIQNKKFSVESSELIYSDVPVSRPTTRGGVYFTDTMSYKAKVTIKDNSILQLLSKTMLGPNTEFAKILLVSDDLQIFANLTNYVQKSDGFELNMTIIETLPAK